MAQTRKQKVRDELARQRRRRRTITLTAILGIAMIAIIVTIIILQLPKGGQNLALVDTPISQAMYDQLSGVTNASFVNAMGTQGISGLQAVTGSPAVTSSGTPEFLYIGADYCPFCAAERWSIIVALEKFGNFTGLKYMLSGSSPEVYPETATFTFHGVTYSSPYITFVGVETHDRSEPNPGTLDTVTSQQQAILNQFNSGGGIPFIDIGNSAGTHYLIAGQNGHSGSQYSPAILQGLNWTQIGSQLDSSSSIARTINAAANTMIHAICQLDGGLPTGICGQTYAQAPFSMAGFQEPSAITVHFQTVDRKGSSFIASAD